MRLHPATMDNARVEVFQFRNFHLRVHRNGVNRHRQHIPVVTKPRSLDSQCDARLAEMWQHDVNRSCRSPRTVEHLQRDTCPDAACQILIVAEGT